MRPAFQKATAAVLLAVSALGLSACSRSNVSEENANAVGIDTAVYTDIETDARACAVGMNTTGLYTSRLYDFNQGFTILRKSVGDYGPTVIIREFNQISTPAAQREVLNAYRLLPHEANCPAPQFSTPATPTTPAATPAAN